MARKANGIILLLPKYSVEAEMAREGNGIPEMSFGNLSWRVTTRKC